MCPKAALTGRYTQRHSPDVHKFTLTHTHADQHTLAYRQLGIDTQGWKTDPRTHRDLTQFTQRCAQHGYTLPDRPGTWASSLPQLHPVHFQAALGSWLLPGRVGCCQHLNAQAHVSALWPCHLLCPLATHSPPTYHSGALERGVPGGQTMGLCPPSPIHNTPDSHGSPGSLKLRCLSPCTVWP